MSSLEAITLHMISDFVLQSNWIAKNKLTDWRVRLVHVGIHGVCFTVWLVWLGQPWLWFVGWLMLSHFIIDSRRWCDDQWPPRPLFVDQTLHLIVLALLLRYF
jgi:hypothetical protein